jgi:hypothetical protein
MPDACCNNLSIFRNGGHGRTEKTPSNRSDLCKMTPRLHLRAWIDPTGNLFPQSHFTLFRSLSVSNHAAPALTILWPRIDHLSLIEIQGLRSSRFSG